MILYHLNYWKKCVQCLFSSRIITKNPLVLKKIIEKEIQKNGNTCDLNHIDTSYITDMSHLFHGSSFNGNISKWDTSRVEDMSAMFFESQFNGDISHWDVSQVEVMSSMFASSPFNGDISSWNISKVRCMNYMFEKSSFDQDISKWDVSHLEDMSNLFLFSQFSHDLSSWTPHNLRYGTCYIFENSLAPFPYWYRDNICETKQLLKNYSTLYSLSEQLENTLENKPISIQNKI